MDIVLDILENSYRTSGVKLSVKLFSANIVNCFGLKFSPDFENTEELSGGVPQK